MHFFAFGVTPASVVSKNHEFTATVSCWIKKDDRNSAEDRAIKFLLEQGWVVVEILEGRPVSRSDYRDESGGLQYFEQALTDDEVLVFYLLDGKTYPDTVETRPTER
jgi:hypothetical protein